MSLGSPFGFCSSPRVGSVGSAGSGAQLASCGVLPLPRLCASEAPRSAAAWVILWWLGDLAMGQDQWYCFGVGAPPF